MTRRTRTLRWHLMRAALRVGVATTAAACVFGYAAAAPSDELPTEESASRAPIGLARSLALQHGCWSGTAPADMVGVVPGHVVVTRPDHTQPEYLGAEWVGPALDRIFNDKFPGLAVHAFCR